MIDIYCCTDKSVSMSIVLNCDVVNLNEMLSAPVHCMRGPEGIHWIKIAGNASMYVRRKNINTNQVLSLKVDV